MLPNVRLMIAATFASLVVLICGFGLFATVRLSHAPLARLPSAVATLPLAAANEPSSLTVAEQEPFAHRFQFGETAGTGAVAALAYAAPLPAEQPVLKAVVPEADNQTQAAPPPPVLTPDAVAGETKPDDAKTAPVVAAPTTAPSLAAIESPPADSPIEHDQPATQRLDSDAADANPTADRISSPLGTSATAEKPAKSPHAAERHHGRGARPNAVAEDTAYPQTDVHDPTATPRPAKIRRSKLTAKTTDQSFGSGGPFVSAPSR